MNVCVCVFCCGPTFCYVCNFVVITKVTKAVLFLTEAKQYFATLLTGIFYMFPPLYCSEFHFNQHLTGNLLI